MADDLGGLLEQALADVDASRTLSDLDEVRVRVLGKKGLLTERKSREPKSNVGYFFQPGSTIP